MPMLIGRLVQACLVLHLAWHESCDVLAANIFLWDRLQPAPGVPAAFLEDFMRAAPKPKSAGKAGHIMARGPQTRLGRSTGASSHYPAVYNAVSTMTQGIVGAVVSSPVSSSNGHRMRVYYRRSMSGFGADLHPSAFSMTEKCASSAEHRQEAGQQT